MARIAQILSFMPGFIGAAVIAASQTAPETSVSNLQAWARFLGAISVSRALENSLVDQLGLVTGSVLIGGTVILLIMQRNPAILHIEAPSNNVFVGEVHAELAKGSRNTVISMGDDNGSVILNGGGIAIGAGAKADATSIAIGAGANSGNLSR